MVDSLHISSARGYISLKDAQIETEVAQACASTIPESLQSNQTKRDGVGHHVTLLNKADVETVFSSTAFADLSKKKALQALLQTVQESCRRDWASLGAGYRRAAGSQAYYMVLVWPSAQRMRASLGLPPACFHVTLGFDPHDVSCQ
jgi:hypothetical protein